MTLGLSRLLMLALTAAALTVAVLPFASPAIAASGAAAPDLVNQTGHTIDALSIRRTGTPAWQPLPATPPRPSGGVRAKSSFTDPDCAFDIQATLDDGTLAVWTGVNLCEVKSVTLNRNASGATWADYD